MLLVASAALADNPHNVKALSIPVAGTFADAGGGIGRFAGTFKVINFAVQNNALVAQGFVTGTLTDSTGTVLGSVVQEVSVPAAVTSGSSAASTNVRTMDVHALASCPILHLDLGPLNLNLLGLQVNLSEVVLDITAQSGAGNLLGNLLCAVANLLNGGGALGQIADLLNQILGILSGILG